MKSEKRRRNILSFTHLQQSHHMILLSHRASKNFPFVGARSIKEASWQARLLCCLLPVTGKRFSCFFVFNAHFSRCLFAINSSYCAWKILTLFTYFPRMIDSTKQWFGKFFVFLDLNNCTVKMFTRWQHFFFSHFRSCKKRSYHDDNRTSEPKLSKQRTWICNFPRSMFTYAFKFNFSLNVFLLPTTNLKQKLFVVCFILAHIKPRDNDYHVCCVKFSLAFMRKEIFGWKGMWWRAGGKWKLFF